jgi:hypothetical protein
MLERFGYICLKLLIPFCMNNSINYLVHQINKQQWDKEKPIKRELLPEMESTAYAPTTLNFTQHFQFNKNHFEPFLSTFYLQPSLQFIAAH